MNSASGFRGRSGNLSNGGSRMDPVKKVLGAFGRLFGGSRAAADLRVRWFGKLPQHADYVAAPDQAQWGHEFTDWLIQGFARYQAALAAAANSSTARLGPASDGASAAPAPAAGPIEAVGLIPVPSGTTVLFALRDFGGDARGRRFPFALFVGTTPAQPAGPSAAVFDSFARVLQDLQRSLAPAAAALNSPDARRFDGGTLDLPPPSDPLDLQQRWRAINWRGWARGASGATDEALPRWYAALAAWGDRIAAHDGPEASFNLSLPLSPDLEWGLQVAGWLSWLARRARLDRRALAIFVPQPAAARIVHIITRPCVGEDALLITPAAHLATYMDSPPSGALPAEARPVSAGASTAVAQSAAEGVTPTARPVQAAALAADQPDAVPPPDFATFATTGVELKTGTRSIRQER